MIRTKTAVPLRAYVLLCAAAWSAAWLTTQALFIIDIPVITPLLDTMNATGRFIVITAIIMVVAAVAASAWGIWGRGGYSFLRTRRALLAGLSFVPLAVIAGMIAIRPDVFGVPGWLYALTIVVTSPIQDLLTFGYLQTALARRVSGWVAALFTALLFFAGHFHYDPDIMTIVFLGAALAFAFLRLKTGNIYAVMWLHMAYLLVTVM